MNTLTPHQSLALNTKGNLALTANAGSGKTFVLARKYLNALITEALDISNVAAITFTEKAASELYNKISFLIEERIFSSQDSKEKKKLEKIRRQLVSANISTIHSFCISILREFPVEAKLDARFTPVDESLSQELIELSVEEAIRLCFENKEHIETIKYLIRIFASKSKLQNQIVRLIQNRKNIFKIKGDFYKLSEEQIARRFKEVFDYEFLTLWKKRSNEFVATIRHINNAVLNESESNLIAIEVEAILNELESANDVKSIIKNLQLIKSTAFTKDLSVRKKGYVKKDTSEILQVEISKIEDLIDEYKNFELSDEDQVVENELAKFGKKLLIVFDKTLDIYENKKSMEGFIDYEDILLHTKILLQNDDVQTRLAEKYKFIMVDEFQDTNEIQYQIFLPILDYLKKGKLFIVGDEKQSIYKFRDAEIEIFNLTRNDIKKSESGDNLLNLPDSFRMAPNICALCNHIFKKLFSEPDEQFGEVPATDLVCARNDDIQGKIEFIISRKSEDGNSILESELIAKKILQIVSGGKYSFKDISILVRKRKHFTELEKSFLKYKIPFTIIGGRGFYQRQVISDIYNYLTFLADKNNSTALVGVLRSPFFTMSDSKIFELSLIRGKSFWEKLNNIQNDEIISTICNTLKENISLSNSIELSQLIEKIITDRNYLSIIASRNDGEQEIANITKLIGIARSFNSTGFRNLYDFLSYLKDSISNQADESQASISSNTDAVQMMTIHQSKGLEFPIVFICNTNESGIPSSIKSGEIKVDKNFGLLSKVPINNNYFEDYHSAPIVNLYNYFEEKKNNAELKRLLYVAITRAKDELYISAEIEDGKKFKKDSFLNLLSKGLQNDFSGSEIILSDKLELLKNINTAYRNESQLITFNISIISEIDSAPTKISADEHDYSQLEINLNAISNREKGEIISASKVSIFNQCAVKYLLTYEYGYGKLNEEIKNIFSENRKNYFISNTDEIDEYQEDLDYGINIYSELKRSKIDAALYGKLFHKAIELSTKINNIDEFVESEIQSVISNSDLLMEYSKKLKTDLSVIYNSQTWKEITGYNNFKNEFEIYVKENDYYLHGIIDKIIFTEKQIKIIDYKTDEIEKKEIKKHSEFYLMQLKFYLYIASRLFIEFDSFEGRLVFIKHPDDPVIVKYDMNQIVMLEQEITIIIESIRNKSSEKNMKHCNVCSFSDRNNNCIVK